MHENAFSFSHLESHATGAVLAPGQHILGGWVMPRPGGHLVDVRARLGDRIFPGILGWPRADLAAHFQTGRPVALAEFKIVVELPPGRAGVAGRLARDGELERDRGPTAERERELTR